MPSHRQYSHVSTLFLMAVDRRFHFRAAFVSLIFPPVPGVCVVAVGRLRCRRPTAAIADRRGVGSLGLSRHTWRPLLCRGGHAPQRLMHVTSTPKPLRPANLPATLPALASWKLVLLTLMTPGVRLASRRVRSGRPSLSKLSNPASQPAFPLYHDTRRGHSLPCLI